MKYFTEIREALTEYGEDVEPGPDRRAARLRRKPPRRARRARAGRSAKSTGRTDTP